ncbi:DegT/DnrJ/EryC1/StrS family aminotransferase [Sulfuricurvum sp.]|uniref:DegT/DnrJ/EryC1/StrS family aminotransferase n=1 Tax=Sulfuricurvum sp. TaxID=2025608 RepID=UPI0035684BFE
MDMIRTAQFKYDSKELRAVKEVFASGWLVHHDKGKEFEEKIAKLHHKNYGVAVCSATEGLYLAVRALSFKIGTVLAPAMTFVSTVNCATRNGHNVRLYDIKSERDLNADFEDIKRKYTDDVVGVVVVHYGGHICEDINKIAAFCKEKGIFLIEDCAHAIGSTSFGYYAGHWGDASVFSFHATKTLAIGEGGMVITDSDVVSKKIRCMREIGRIADEIRKYDVIIPSGKCAMTEYQCAIGLVQLEKLAGFRKHLSKLGRTYMYGCLNIAGLTVPFARDYLNSDTTVYNFTVILPVDVNREEIQTFLKMKNIETTVEYQPIYRLALYTEHQKYTFPKIQVIEKRLLTLPVNVCMTLTDVKYVCEMLNYAITKNRGHNGNNRLPKL